MKSKYAIIIFLINIISFPVIAQDTNKTRIDEKSQMEILIGLCNRRGLQSSLFKTYYDSEYAAYKTDSATIAELKKILASKNIKITIVMGSWCGDSQEQVPGFYKILDATGFSDNNVTLYCVDRSKKTDKGETAGLNITLVPTFIFYLDGKETGRITETPKESLEKDMLGIVSN
jgi:hypothetical protein